MRVILDANVAIAAVAARGLCEAVVELCVERHEIIIGQEILDDIEEKLRKKLKVSVPVVAEYLNMLNAEATLVVPEKLPKDTCRDPDDNAVLGLVVPGHAEVIISGDKDLLTLVAFKGCRILSPRAFWEQQLRC